MAKHIDDFGESFAELYCKEGNVSYDKGSPYSNYADLGNYYSYIKVGWEEKGILFEEQIKPMDALNLIAKYALTKEKKAN